MNITVQFHLDPEKNTNDNGDIERRNKFTIQAPLDITKLAYLYRPNSSPGLKFAVVMASIPLEAFII
jgi:hypothetical protein